jgi:CheY-like chemotaxis protein
LRHVCELTRLRAQNAGLQFDSEEIDTLPPRVIADARALRQMLINLLGNAVKFTPAGGRVALGVSALSTSESRCKLRFAIEDSGVGIAPDQLERIFEPFHRVIDERRSVEGTGLGLAITRRLAAAMGGEIEVQSQPGVGSIFIFSVALEVATQEQAEQHLDARISGYEGARRRILVADDDPVNRTLVYRLLSGLGFEMQRAGNGLEALQLIKLSPPDLLITDLVMPQVDGMELVRTLRADARTQSIPVIALSASASEYSRDEALRQGCDAFVAKPLRLASLLDELQTLLSLQWRRDAMAATIEADTDVECPPDYLLDPLIAGELGNLAMQGDIATLTSRLKETLAGDPAAQSLYAQIISHAEHYDMRAIRRLLSSHTVPGFAGTEIAAR